MVKLNVIALDSSGRNTLERIRELEEQETQLEKITGLTLCQLLDLFREGYTLQPPSKFLCPN